MSDQIIAILKKELDDLAFYGELNADVRQNKLKETLQYYVLDFIYHHPKYSKWVMYGGSALRIIHGLDRMSVDLDFEVASEVDKNFLDKLEVEIKKHFENKYRVFADFLTIKSISTRSLLLKFNIGSVLDFGHTSKQVHVKIDLNHFIAQKTVTERRPINQGQISLVVLTYNKGALMASKIAAILLREERGVADKTYEYKGRDIYDLLWYMREKTVPDFDYLNAKLKEKNREMPNIRTLFDTLTTDLLNYEKMDACLKDDLQHLFENPHRFDDWLSDWRDSYLRLLNNYKIRTVIKIEKIRIMHWVNFGKAYEYHFEFWYQTAEDRPARIIYRLREDCIIYGDYDVVVDIDKNLDNLIEFFSNASNAQYARTKTEEDKFKRYATLFYRKIENYFKKTNRVMVGDVIATKVIRMTSDNFNPKEQILLNRSALESIEFDDLLK